jgi:maltokinase
VSTRGEQVAPYLLEARWFGGKGRAAEVGEVRRLGRIGESTEPVVAIDLVEVDYTDGSGERELYQLPLALYAEPQERIEHAHVGTWEEPDLGLVHAYDAVHDREAMAEWLTAFDRGEHVLGGQLEFHRLVGHELDLTTHSTLFSGEQSNSSVMFGEDALLKVFRKVTPGRNPDIAVHDVLTRAGSDHVAELYGWLEAAGEDEEPLQLAMLQQFLRTASDGWDLALASVRNLFAEGDLHADEVGGDFAGEAARLGAALAEVHATLAAEFPTEQRDRRAMVKLAGDMQRRLDAALPVVPGLADHEEGLRAAYERVAGLEGDTAQQVHGDLHLGQTLRTVRGWKIVDFEGEPAKSLAERQRPDSPWRDVAGMLRSFDYAPRAAAMSLGAPPEQENQIAHRATEWSARNRRAFLAAYAGQDPDDLALAAAEEALLAAYVADKAVYEAVYETRNRPTWVGIPLAAIARELSTHGGVA